MKVKTESVCKTREAAKRGERSKPHYYLPYPKSRFFSLALAGHHNNADEDALQALESRIDWSTWGR